MSRRQQLESSQYERSFWKSNQSFRSWKRRVCVCCYLMILPWTRIPPCYFIKLQSLSYLNILISLCHMNWTSTSVLSKSDFGLTKSAVLQTEFWCLIKWIFTKFDVGSTSFKCPNIFHYIIQSCIFYAKILYSRLTQCFIRCQAIYTS